MPRPVPIEEWHPVSFPELVAKIGTGTFFTIDKLVGMLAAAEKKKEDFRIVHGDIRYFVPIEKIKEYFEDHLRPVPKMSLKEEVEYLRSRVQKLEASRLEPEDEQAPEMKPHPEIQERPKRGRPPKLQERGIEVPTPDQMNADEIRQSLVEDLKESEPFSRNSPVEKKRREKEKG